MVEYIDGNEYDNLSDNEKKIKFFNLQHSHNNLSIDSMSEHKKIFFEGIFNPNNKCYCCGRYGTIVPYSLTTHDIMLLLILEYWYSLNIQDENKRNKLKLNTPSYIYFHPKVNRFYINIEDFFYYYKGLRKERAFSFLKHFGFLEKFDPSDEEIEELKLDIKWKGKSGMWRLLISNIREFLHNQKLVPKTINVFDDKIFSKSEKSISIKDVVIKEMDYDIYLKLLRESKEENLENMGKRTYEYVKNIEKINRQINRHKNKIKDLRERISKLEHNKRFSDEVKLKRINECSSKILDIQREINILERKKRDVNF